MSVEVMLATCEDLGFKGYLCGTRLTAFMLAGGNAMNTVGRGTFIDGATTVASHKPGEHHTSTKVVEGCTHV
jgi:hypothetical protein